MTEQEQQRFEMLRQGPCVPPDYVSGYYGLPWPVEGEFGQDYQRWVSKLRRRQTCEGGWTSRYELESFMQQKRVVPKKWMGAQLGMSIASLEQLLARLGDIGMRLNRYEVYKELIAESLADDIVTELPGLKFYIPRDHNSFCARLHADLDKELGIKVQPLFCATSDRMQDYTKQYASNFDCITLDPLSVKHQLWLDFRKPLNLAPDRCSN